jgi:hypothetical protein
MYLLLLQLKKMKACGTVEFSTVQSPGPRKVISIKWAKVEILSSTYKTTQGV